MRPTGKYATWNDWIDANYVSYLHYPLCVMIKFDGYSSDGYKNV